MVGITYVTLREVDRKREQQLKYEETKESDTLEPLTREDEIKAFEQLKKDLEEFKKSSQVTTIVFPKKSRFMRKHIYELLKTAYPEFVGETAPGNEYDKDITVFKFKTESDRGDYLMNKKKKEDDEFWWKIGFANVFDLLVQNKKKLIGHNCLFDILFVYSHFYDYLPQSYSDFKNHLHKIFPE
jgi:poly(A)-specific ribonuclease